MDRPLSRESLAALKSVLDADRSSSKIPRRALVELGTVGDEDVVVDVDLEAQAELGVPVVVVERSSRPDVDTSDLTPRELQVARLVAEGLSNKQIARLLMISLATAKDHVHNVLSKTGMPSRAALAARMRTG